MRVPQGVEQHHRQGRAIGKPAANLRPVRIAEFQRFCIRLPETKC